MNNNDSLQDADCEDGAHDYIFNDFRRLKTSLSTLDNCLLYDSRVRILKTLPHRVLDLLYTGHFGIQWTKQLARSAIY